jgi:hypothetical protein
VKKTRAQHAAATGSSTAKSNSSSSSSAVIAAVTRPRYWCESHKPEEVVIVGKGHFVDIDDLEQLQENLTRVSGTTITIDSDICL